MPWATLPLTDYTLTTTDLDGFHAVISGFPGSEALHGLFPLPGMLFPQLFPPLAGPFHPSGFSSRVTCSERSSFSRAGPLPISLDHSSLLFFFYFP